VLLEDINDKFQFLVEGHSTLNNKIDNLDNKIDKVLDELHAISDEVKDILKVHSIRLDEHEERISRVEHKG
jgi:hypothetical protein